MEEKLLQGQEDCALLLLSLAADQEAALAPSSHQTGPAALPV